MFLPERNISNRIIIESRNCLFCGTQLLLTVNSGVMVLANLTCGTRFWKGESIRIKPGQIGLSILLENHRKKKQHGRGTYGTNKYLQFLNTLSLQNNGDLHEILRKN